MRKALLGMLMLVGGATGWAQNMSDTPVASLEELVNGYYVIKGTTVAGDATGYIHYDPDEADGRLYRLSESYGGGDTPNPDYVWMLVNNANDGTFTLENAQHGVYFIADASRNQNFTESEMANLKIVVQDNSWYMTMTNYQHQTDDGTSTDTYLCVNKPDGDPNLSWWPGIGNSSDLLLEFYPVTDTEEGALEGALISYDTSCYITPYFDNPGCIVLVDGEAKALPADVATSLQSDYDALLVSPTETAYETLLTRVNEALVAPEDGIWTITSTASNTRGGQAVTSKNTVVAADGSSLSNNSLITETPDGTAAPMLWKFQRAGEGEDGGYKLLNLNTDYTLAGSSSQVQIQLSTDEKADNNTYTFAERTDGNVALACGSYYLNAWSGANGFGLGLYNGVNDANSGWKVELADTIDQSISSAGYATVCFPVAVQLPEEVTAYTVTGETEEAVTLAEYEGTELPANTAVLIAADEGSYSFAITDADNGNTDTGLDGVCASAIIADDVTAYVLAMPGEADEAGFYLLADNEGEDTSNRTLGANKAYYVSTNGTAAANALSFAFGGGTATGISSAATAEAADSQKVYYDLNGRRVLYPSRGIYVTADGQKVFIK